MPQAVTHAKDNLYRSKFFETEQLIEENFKTIKFPKDYAALMHISEQQLNRICKACVNLTITNMISERVVLEAKRMLIHSELSVGEIAFDLGYIDQSYFIRFFKKMTGKTPLEFGQKNKK